MNKKIFDNKIQLIIIQSVLVAEEHLQLRDVAEIAIFVSCAL